MNFIQNMTQDCSSKSTDNDPDKLCFTIKNWTKDSSIVKQVRLRPRNYDRPICWIHISSVYMYQNALFTMLSIMPCTFNNINQILPIAYGLQRRRPMSLNQLPETEYQATEKIYMSRLHILIKSIFQTMLMVFVFRSYDKKISVNPCKYHSITIMASEDNNILPYHYMPTACLLHALT
jgi:hypothetical protein